LSIVNCFLGVPLTSAPAIQRTFGSRSESAYLSKQYAQRAVFANARYLSRLCRRRTSMLASYRGSVEWTMHYTVALGYCLNRCALSERGTQRKRKYYLNNRKTLIFQGSLSSRCDAPQSSTLIP